MTVLERYIIRKMPTANESKNLPEQDNRLAASPVELGVDGLDVDVGVPDESVFFMTT